MKTKSVNPSSQSEVEEAIKSYIVNLFSGLHDMYDNKGILNEAILNELEVAFTLRYLNYQMGYENENIFSQKLYYEIMKYSDYLFNISDEYKEMFDAAVTITNKGKKTKTYEETGNSNRDYTNTSNETRVNTGKNNISNSGSSSSTTDSNGSSTSSNEGKNDNNITTNSNGSSRNINADYPQSSLELNMNFPLSNFTYASTGSDNANKNSGTEDNLNTFESETNNSATSKVTDIGTSSSEGEINNTQSYNGNISGTTKYTENSDRDGSEIEDNSSELETISPFEKTRLLMELVDKYKYSPIYRVVEYLEKLFLGTFADDERYYYISTDFISSWFGGV